MRQTNKITIHLVFLFVLFTFPHKLNAQRAEPEKVMIQNEPMYKLLKPGDIPAIFEPEHIPLDKADSFYYDDEPLIVTIDGDSAKAYSIWHLDRHEVVNDYINGKAITVTW
jgi:hypothetical protein